MSERYADLVSELERFEPGGTGDELARALTSAAIAIARAVESIHWNPEGSGASSIQELSHQLQATNEKLDNFVKVLSSLPAADE